MSLRRIRQPLQVEIDPSFAEYVATTTAARQQCLRELIKKLPAGKVDLVAAFRPGLYFIFACDVTIAAVTSSGTVVLGSVTEGEE